MMLFEALAAQILLAALTVILLVQASRETHDRRHLPQRLFIWMLAACLGAAAADALLRAPAASGGTLPFWLAASCLCLRCGLQALALSLWAWYARCVIRGRGTGPEPSGWPWLAWPGLVFLLGGVAALGGRLTATDSGPPVFDGGIHALVLGLAGLPLLHAGINTVLRRPLLPARSFQALLLFLPLPALALLGDLIQPRWCLLPGATALALLILHLRFQNSRGDSDYLTGLYNRRFIEDHLAERLRFPDSTRLLGLIKLDLDHFRQINDSWGRHEGDRAIETAARLLRKCLHHEDVIARLSGDEFVVVCDLDRPEGLEAILGRLRGLFDAWNRDNLEPWRLQFSAGGICVRPDGSQNADQLLQRADFLMYENKAQRNRTHS
jgi:diguanylate cyclase (GGDEF)-like protein